MPDLPAFLKELRLRSGLNQNAVGGLDKSQVSRFEKGDRTPKPEQLVLLAEAYGVDRHFLLLYADFLELPGFELLRGEFEEEHALGELLQETTVDERRLLIKYLAGLRSSKPRV